MTAVTESLVERLRRLDKEATSGPWARDPYDAGKMWSTPLPGVERHNLKPEDVDFIVAMRNALPELLRLVEAAQNVYADGVHRGVEKTGRLYELRDALAALDAPEAQT